MKHSKSLCSVFAISLVFVSNAWSQDANLQKALARAQFTLKKVNAEKLALQQEKQAVEEKLKEIQQELELTEREAEEKERKLKATLADWKASHGRLKENLGDTRGDLARAKQVGQRLAINLEQQSENFAICYENNLKLADINKDLVARYEDKSAFDSIMQREPVFQYKRVDVENMVQDYRYKIEDLNLRLMEHLIKPVDKVPEESLQAVDVNADYSVKQAAATTLQEENGGS